jgi:rubrerythrin
MAADLERNGTRFYARAAALTTQEGLRSLFLGLAEMEEAHRRRFHALREAQQADEDAAVPRDAEMENSLYLQALADAHVFALAGDALEAVLRQATPTAMLNLALDCEKESIVFFLTLQELLPPSAGRAVLEAVIHEELQHIRQLRGEKSAVARRMSLPAEGEAL